MARAGSRTSARHALARWLVHLGLLAATAASLLLEPVLTLHLALGLLFVGLVVVHLRQRRRVTLHLLRRLRPTGWRGAGGRLALADLLLASVTAVMLASGLWDWLGPHRTRIRWHAISGVVLTVLIVVHTVRRWRRLRTSAVS